jgi:hypothetical protein
MDSGLPKGSHPRPTESVLQQNYAVHRLLPSPPAYFERHARWLTLYCQRQRLVNRCIFQRQKSDMLPTERTGATRSGRSRYATIPSHRFLILLTGQKMRVNARKYPDRYSRVYGDGALRSPAPSPARFHARLLGHNCGILCLTG